MLMVLPECRYWACSLLSPLPSIRFGNSHSTPPNVGREHSNYFAKIRILFPRRRPQHKKAPSGDETFLTLMGDYLLAAVLPDERKGFAFPRSYQKASVCTRLV